MCSTICECDNAHVLNNDESLSQIKLCRKCQSSSYIVLGKIHPECKNCFLESCNKKLRSAIGRSKRIRNNDPVLIAYSGGTSSTALLDLVRNSLQFETGREQKFRPSILYIDILSTIVCEFKVVRSRRNYKLKQLLASVHELYPEWPLYWSTLEMATAEVGSNEEALYSKYDAVTALSSSNSIAILDDEHAFNELSIRTKDLDPTDRQECIEGYTNELINRIALDIKSSSRHCDKFKCVFTASCSDRLATNLLVDVVLGKGATSSSVGICDNRSKMLILRPMRDFTKKEVTFYLKARGIDDNKHESLAPITDPKTSIQGLTEAFLSMLGVDYPSTFSTLIRTGDKLHDH